MLFFLVVFVQRVTEVGEEEEKSTPSRQQQRDAVVARHICASSEHSKACLFVVRVELERVRDLFSIYRPSCVCERFQASLQQTSSYWQQQCTRGGEGHRGKNRQAIAGTRGILPLPCLLNISLEGSLAFFGGSVGTVGSCIASKPCFGSNNWSAPVIVCMNHSQSFVSVQSTEEDRLRARYRDFFS